MPSKFRLAATAEMRTQSLGPAVAKPALATCDPIFSQSPGWNVERREV